MSIRDSLFALLPPAPRLLLRVLSVSGAATLALLLPGPALACAGFYHDEGSFAESNRQEAIFRILDGGVQVDYRVALDVNTPGFGWVIPVPGVVSKVEDGDDAEFEELETLTAPTRDLAESEGSGCNAYALKSNAGGSGETRSDNGYTVVYSGSTPTYDYTVLEATSSDALAAWLGENGWELGATESSIEAYVAQGGFQFLAVKLHIDVDDGEAVAATLPPLRISHSGSSLIFPSRMAQFGDVEYLETRVYVVGEGRAHVSGWKEEELPLVWDDGEDPDYMLYSALPEAIGAIGREGAFAVTYSGEWQGAWVTRFDTTADRMLHTVDAVFTVGTDKTELQTMVSNQGGCRAPEGASWLWVPLLGLLRRKDD